MLAFIDIFLTVLTIYFILGSFFALYFLFKGFEKIDPVLINSKKRVRLLLLPGTIVTWPFLVYRLINSNKK